LLRSEINQLEKLIADILENSGINNYTDNNHKFTGQVEAVHSTCEELQSKWVHELFSSAKEQTITRYVQYHQAGITHLSNQLSRSLEIVDRWPATQQLQIKALVTALEELLTFLKNQCYRYFDLDYTVTIYRCERHYVKINEFKQELLSYREVKIDASLLKVISHSIDEVITEALESGISYRQLDHVLNLLRIVHQRTQIILTTSTLELAQALYRQNLNTLHFSNWYQDFIEREIAKQVENREKINYVKEQIQYLSGIFINTEKAFEPDLPSIDETMLTWLNARHSNNFKGDFHESKSNLSIRLALNLSVPQFAMFIRIFSQVGCFPETTVARISRFFTRHFATKKQDDISLKSFRRAFYSLDQASAAIVRDYLQKMLDYLNKTYFP